MSAEGEEEKVNRRELLTQQVEAEQEELEFGAEPDLNIHPDSYERGRGPDGKFLPKERPETQENSVSRETAAAVETKEPPVWERPPRSWKKETHELWAQMPEKAREYYVQRENEMLARYSELGPKAKLADQINEVAQPYMNTMRGLGIDLPRAVKGLMEADNNLRTLPPDQRQAYFINLGRSYGINLSGAHAPQPQPQNGYDPNFLLNQLNNLRGELGSFKEQQEAAQQAEALAHVNQFASTHEYFEELRPTITRLIETGLETTLDGAYNHALKVNDELSEQIQSAQQVETGRAQRETANRAAKAAKAAAVSVRGSSPGSRPASKAQDRRSMLREQLDGMDERL